MGYVIVGGVCLVLGACIGIFTVALVSLNADIERAERKEREIYTGTCNLSATHAVPEEAKDADR